MELSFKEKSDLNYRLIDLLKLKLMYKDIAVLPPEGQIYEKSDPYSLSLAGSIGQEPNPEFDGPQAPSSMGMVLLVAPGHENKVECTLSGQFDIIHRIIPRFKFMKESLETDIDGKVKPAQIIPGCFQRNTVCFDNITLKFEFNPTSKLWIPDQQTYNLDAFISKTNEFLLKNEQIFRRANISKSGNAMLKIDWDCDIISDQATLNNEVFSQLYANSSEILNYNVQIRGRIRKAPRSLVSESDAFLLELFLENKTSDSISRAFGVTRPQLLDCSFSARFIEGKCRKLPHRLSPEDYRFAKNDGVPGYGITCGVEVKDGLLCTTSLPMTGQQRVDTPEAKRLGMCIEPSFKELAENPIPILRDMVKAIDQYAKEWQTDIEAAIKTNTKEEVLAMTKDRLAFTQERKNIVDGIDLLESKPGLKQTFQWMNTAMMKAIELQRKSFTSWRLFQLGFILTQIRAVYEQCCDIKEITAHLNTAEVLWFATGGGKTEAYLGIMIMGMLYQRLSGKQFGTTAWMRFPLRMLSVQQFQRLSYVVAQANIIRQVNDLRGHPFTIGYFTGSGTAKNISSNSDYYSHDFLPNLDDKGLRRFKFISDCPYCTEEDTISIQKHIENSRIKHVCTNEQCWSNTSAEEGKYGEGIKGEIGIFVSDEECYRYLPTITVGTIDKLAVIAFNIKFRLFLGQAKYFCPQHGFTPTGKCIHFSIVSKGKDGYDSEHCKNNSTRSAVKTISLQKDPFPGFAFLLQDELHLLREDLGNFDAHYETLLVAMQQSLGGRAPKILTATATIKDYEDHIHHLYQRKANRFPAQGRHQNESFYSRIIFDKNKQPLIRRIYVGILPLTGSNRAVAGLNVRYFSLIDSLREQLASNSVEACKLLGFNSEYADVLLDHINKNMNTGLIYVNSKRSIVEIENEMDSDEMNIGVSPIRLDGDTPLDEIQRQIKYIETKGPDEKKRQIIATSVVSHGIDIERLNFMTMSGWPKSTAEYVQSSARAGRVHPGIIFSVLKFQNLYECNIFLDFADFHFFLDKLVESVPINRFAPNVLQRTYPGILSAVLINWATNFNWGDKFNQNAGIVQKALLKDKEVYQKLKNQLLASLQVPVNPELNFDERVVNDFNKTLENMVKESLSHLEGLSASLSSDCLSYVIAETMGFPPLRSFRDIENQIDVSPCDNDTEELIDALSREWS